MRFCMQMECTLLDTSKLGRVHGTNGLTSASVVTTTVRVRSVYLTTQANLSTLIHATGLPETATDLGLRRESILCGN